jgi:ABC-type Fe3+-hydroxamate transport system substrate-binding protein
MPFSFTNTTNLPQAPTKIISTVPSITELLWSLQLGSKVVGITKFCIHPNQWYTTKPRIGGTKNLKIDNIKALNPDLVIANKEENIKEQIEAIAQFTNVYVSDVYDLASAYNMIQIIGNLTHTTPLATSIVTQLQHSFSSITPFTPTKRVAYLIWQEPYITVGAHTFIHHMLQQIGLTNVFENQLRYPTISITDLQQAHCDYIFLSSEPFPFQQKHIDALQVFLPHTKILLVNGELFSWYGSRLLQFNSYYNNVLAQQLV